MQKTILLGLPAIYDIGQLMKENLELLDFKVIDISFQYSGDFKYKNLRQRAYNFYRKIVLGDKSYKDKLKFRVIEADIIQKLNELEQKIDYAFIIRPDTYSKKVIELIKAKSYKLIGYQWDGLKRFPWIKEYIPYFDRFFVFDIEDLKNNDQQDQQLLYLTNFYFDLPELLTKPEVKGPKVYFIGTYNRDRMPMLESIIQKTNDLAIKSNIFLYSRRSKQPTSHLPNIRICNEKFSFKRNIEMLKDASVLIDIPVKFHNGLSFRMFEALCFEKKVITNNTSIKMYDFYNPNNIFIMDEDDINNLQSFLNTPYDKIDPEIRRKYGFTNWIHYVLAMEPYVQIDCPFKFDK